jgi:DNA modification methylase
MKVELIEIGRVIPYARNPRKNEAAIAKVAASIKEYGFRQPIVVDEEMVIIAGHTRLQAAQTLALKKVPVHVATGLTPAQIKAYRLADNRTHEDAEWDEELLAIELGELNDLGFDLDLTGFDAIELEELLDGAAMDGLTEDDAIPEAPEVPVSKEGDIWLLGDHKLICGDSTKAKTMKALMGDELADMVFTDPPYNVDYGQTMKDNVRGTKRKIKNDNLGADFKKFLTDACTEMVKVCKGALYICMSSSELHTLHSAFADAGGKWSTFIIWGKNHFTMGRSDYQRQYEPILYGWPEGNKHFWCGARDQSDLWHYDKPKSNDLHPTMKPVELVCRALTNSSKTKDIVLDSFGGSGTTLIAAEKLQRRARLIELDPAYVDVIVQRWEEFTGKSAMLAGEKKSFKDVAKKRQAAS